MMALREIIGAAGGSTALASRCGVSSTAIYNWLAHGRIPARHWIPLWRMAKERGLDWRPPGTEGLDLVILPATAGDDADSAAFAQCSTPAPAPAGEAA